LPPGSSIYERIIFTPSFKITPRCLQATIPSVHFQRHVYVPKSLAPCHAAQSVTVYDVSHIDAHWTREAGNASTPSYPQPLTASFRQQQLTKKNHTIISCRPGMISTTRSSPVNQQKGKKSRTMWHASLKCLNARPPVHQQPSPPHHTPSAADTAV
jgi:hypothetical protein